MSLKTTLVAKFPFMLNFFRFSHSEQNSELPLVSLPRPIDPEIGTESNITPSNSSYEKSDSFRRQSILKTLLCVILMMIPLISFVLVQGFIGISSENIGLTPAQEPKPKVQPRITGGIDAEKGEFGHQILIRYRDVPLCGGTLIKKNIVITAAHCFENSENPNDYKIVAGEYNLQEEEGTEQYMDVSKIRKHPEFDLFRVYNDIALLQLTENVNLNANVQTIEITENPAFVSGEVITVIGWGAITEETGGSLYDILQKVQVPIVSSEKCSEIYGDSVSADGSAVCAGFPKGIKDACQADSGGPMLRNEGNKYTLMGLVSWGIGCGREGYPGVYSSVPFFSDWIKKTIAEFNG